LLTQANLQNFIKANPVTDAEVKAEYDSKIAAEKGTEFKARHILVKTEAEAKKLITELGKGADFAKLANKNSLDAKESQNGGDLGWFSAAQMVVPFSEAVAALEKGKYTKEPVKTQFGFHVILKEDSRPVTPPPLEAVKEQLTPFLQRKKVQDMIETLRKQAKVEILVPLTEEQPKAEAAPA
ncbi:MAG: peptidylprolyl isomerase, partial [Methylobacter sp.]|nr:peptidylprolyl isomerase [Candidatus Methylobacter titanis]